MSDLRIALVAEGPTDYVIIQAALKAFLPDPFVMTQLQPEATTPAMGNGWCGVLKWCYSAAQRHSGPIEQDPTLVGYDIVIIHLDVDVALMSYSNCGSECTRLAQMCDWESLPCAQTCPPVSSTCQALQTTLDSWLGQATFGPQSVVCLPAQSTGTWLAAAILPSGHPLLANAECNPGVENALPKLPQKNRVKKTQREYQMQAHHVTKNWGQVKTLCSQAQIFEADMLSALSSI